MALWLVLYVAFVVLSPTFPTSATLFLADGFPITWNYLADLAMILLVTYGLSLVGLKRFRRVGLSAESYFIAFEVIVAVFAAIEIAKNAPPLTPPPFDGILELAYFATGAGFWLTVFSMFKRNKTAS